MLKNHQLLSQKTNETIVLKIGGETAMDTKVIDECSHGSLADTLSFPEVVKRLMQVNVERYSVDLVRMEKYFYGKNGETYLQKIDFEGAQPIAEDFVSEQVGRAVRSIQQGKINYLEFLKEIMVSGTSNYTVYIDGKQVVYFGRKGETHIEQFPSQKD